MDGQYPVWSRQEKQRKTPGRYLLVALVLSLGFGGLYFWGGGDLHAEDAAEKSAKAAPGGPEEVMRVEVVPVEPQNIKIWTDYPGRLQPVDAVEVRPQVSGVITEVLFEEGGVVEKDAPLFQIDPRPFEAEVNEAKAALNAAYSEAALAKEELERGKSLLEKDFVSKSIYDKRKRDAATADSAIRSARARLEKARLNLEYASITAPIAGRVSRAEMTVGNLVQSGQNAPVLTTIVASDYLYAEFDVDEQTYLKAMRSKARGNAAFAVEMTLGGDDVIYQGEIHSFDNQLNPDTGTIRARALFKNTDGVLVPGMYADIRLGTVTPEPVLLVSEKAIGTDQSKKFLYVINDANQVEYREITLGAFVEGRRVITSGLEPGERVAMSGLQRLRPQMTVEPVVIAGGENVSSLEAAIASELAK